ncbi:MAG: HD domain-containing phosphohydrolase [Candidatus Baltobacteraceae bacterium]|jgi:HD-GYP domain-containing protein (c-di-GMP phosphodiesterase class II)
MMFARTVDARGVTEARAEIVEALVAPLTPGERTLIVQLVARSFVDSYAHALERRDPSALIAWVDKMCETHGASPVVGKLFASACTSFDAFLEEHAFDDAVRRPLRTLNGALQSVVGKPRGRVQADLSHLDEVDAAIEELVSKLDITDPLTAEHSRAVAAWCGRLSRRLTLDDREASFVSRCGMIHDIGKVTTPPTILQAPRKLTDDEWKVIREHTVAGELIIREDDRLACFASAIRNHHERLDGHGYPDHLDRDAISHAIRIVTVADCFNAMIGRRPYRPPMPPSLALEELDRHAGTQFDPEVVEAMHQVVNPR